MEIMKTVVAETVYTVNLNQREVDFLAALLANVPTNNIDKYVPELPDTLFQIDTNMFQAEGNPMHNVIQIGIRQDSEE